MKRTKGPSRFREAVGQNARATIIEMKRERRLEWSDERLAEEAGVLRYEPQTDRSLVEQLKSSLYPSTEYIDRQIPRPRRLLKPWLAEGSLTLIYGPTGIGKTWLGLLVGFALTRSEQEDLDVGPWQAKHQAGVIYVDGEMNNWKLQDNLRELALPLPPEDAGSPLLVLSAHDFAQAHEKRDLTIRNRLTIAAGTED